MGIPREPVFFNSASRIPYVGGTYIFSMFCPEVRAAVLFRLWRFRVDIYLLGVGAGPAPPAFFICHKISRFKTCSLLSVSALVRIFNDVGCEPDFLIITDASLKLFVFPHLLCKLDAVVSPPVFGLIEGNVGKFYALPEAAGIPRKFADAKADCFLENSI